MPCVISATLSITEATIEDNFHEPNVEYECMAVGTPSNISFVWHAEDTRNNNIRVAIPDSMVETSMEDRETESELELKSDGGRYENPSCTASNGFVTRTINPRDFETSESYIRTCETCSCIKVCSKLNLKRVHFTLNTYVKCVSIHFFIAWHTIYDFCLEGVWSA